MTIKSNQAGNFINRVNIVISQEQLKGLLHYDPDTGVFTRLVSTAGHVKVGDVAGTHEKSGYIRISVKNKQYRAHRLAWFYMKGVWPKNQIDHDDHVRHNNRWNNLFEATNQDNSKNQTKRKTNTSGITGVYWNKPLGKWEGKIKVDGKSKYLGVHPDKFEIICARKSAENKHGFHENHGQQ